MNKILLIISVLIIGNISYAQCQGDVNEDLYYCFPDSFESCHDESTSLWYQKSSKKLFKVNE